MNASTIMRPGAVALVTGASSGIGQSIAEALLARGLRVICAARRLDRLQEIYDARETALPLALDVTDATAVATMIESLPANWREIDIVIANAGSDVGGRRRFDEGEMIDWASTVTTNVTGLIAICHAVIPGMLARARGHVVTIGSIAGLSTYPGGSIYAATKHAVRAFTDGLRKDYSNEAIRITEILPGMVRTGFAEARHRGDAETAAAFYESFPAILEPGDIAAAALYALEQPDRVNVSQMVVVPAGDK